MDQAAFYRAILFRVFGSCILLLFLFWNPLTLRPRSWNAHVVARSMTVDAALLIVGVGLILVRRWAALLLTGLVAFVLFLAIETSSAKFLGIILAVPLIAATMFWRKPLWADRAQDLWLLPAGLAASACLHYVAFLFRAH